MDQERMCGIIEEYERQKPFSMRNQQAWLMEIYNLLHYSVLGLLCYGFPDSPHTVFNRLLIYLVGESTLILSVYSPWISIPEAGSALLLLGEVRGQWTGRGYKHESPCLPTTRCSSCTHYQGFLQKKACFRLNLEFHQDLLYFLINAHYLVPNIEKYLLSDLAQMLPKVSTVISQAVIRNQYFL